MVLRKRDRRGSMTIDHFTILLYIIVKLFWLHESFVSFFPFYYNLEIQENDGFLCFGFNLIQTVLKSDEKVYTAGSELFRGGWQVKVLLDSVGAWMLGEVTHGSTV